MKKNDADSLARAVIMGKITFDELERDPNVDAPVLRNARIIYINMRKSQSGFKVDEDSGEEEAYDPNKKHPDGALSIKDAADAIGMKHTSLGVWLSVHKDFREKYTTQIGPRRMILKEGIEILKDRKSHGGG